ncbi:asparagine synthase (glutamine-hydrolyzing) [Nitratifractor sp.]
MCGIAGAWRVPLDRVRLEADLRHRGPDESGLFRAGALSLFHTRLAIQDIEGGRQPMEDERAVVVFNGEIYNHLELRRDLEGYPFRTRSDTETLLALYGRYGKELFSRIDGMYAFALYDKERQTLLLAVDPAGKKPLYLFRDASGAPLFFASELGALAHQVSLTIDEEAIAAYLRAGFFPGTVTPYRGVERIGAGEWVEVDLADGGIRQGRHFDLLERYRSKKIVEEGEALEAVERALERGVRRRLLSSDLEVGAFLSGGIDSSLVVALASRHTDRLRTFTVAFEGGYDESALAAKTAARYGTDHHTLRISMKLRDDVERILGSYGMPFADSSAIPSWYVSRAAKERVSVVLNGDGADELFGGYRRYVPVAGGWLGAARLLHPLLALLPAPHEKQSLYNYLYRLLQISSREGAEFYLSATSDLFEGLYTFPPNPYIEALDRKIRTHPLRGLEKMLALDFELLLFDDLLVKMDIATMAHSLEARSPFLSREILELAPRLDPRLKVRGTTTKRILRILAERYLPAEVVTQPKRGFEVPLRDWIEGELREPVLDALSPGCYSERFIDRRFLERLRTGGGGISREKRAKMLWTLYALETWKERG